MRLHGEEWQQWRLAGLLSPPVLPAWYTLLHNPVHTERVISNVFLVLRKTRGCGMQS
jgi:hypothetical protein